MLTGDVKWGALRAADVFVLPSHTENFGVVVVESLAVGRPVLISNQVSIWPDIHAAGAGFIDDDTPDGTERLLRRWLSVPSSDRTAMSLQARTCFAAHFSMERAAISIRALFADAAADPGAQAGGPTGP